MKISIVGLLILLAAQPLAAQSPADLPLLHRLDLALTVGAPLDTTRSTDGVVRQLHDGIRWVVEWQRTTSRTPVERALLSFDAAGARRSHWPWPRYFAARTYLLMHWAGLPILASAGQLAGETHVQSTLRHLDAALAADPFFMPGRRLLAELLLAGGDRELDKFARQAVAREMTLDHPLPELQIVHARAFRAERKHQEALAAFEAAVFGGGDRPLLALERARTLTALGDTTAATAAYWQGVDHLSAAARPAYRQDLGWIVGDDSLATFDAEPLERVGAWLHRFWAERDAAAANLPGERLRTHLARWVTAHDQFRVPLPWRRNFYSRFWNIAGGADCIANASAFVDSLPLHPPTIPGDPRSREPLLDHRGFLWMRHGPPLLWFSMGTESEPGRSAGELERSQQPLPFMGGTGPVPLGNAGAPPLPGLGLAQGAQGATRAEDAVTMETWIYWIEGRWRSLHLGASETFGRHAPTTLLPHLPLLEGPWLAVARLLPQYMRTAILLNPDLKRAAPKSCLPEVTDAVQQMRADAHVGITSDSDSPPFTRPWNASIRSFAIGGGTTTSGQALVTFALSARDLRADTLADGRLAWRVNFRAVAFRGSDGFTRTNEFTHTFVTGAVAANNVLTGLFEWPLDPGSWQLAVRTWQTSDSSGAYALRRRLVVDEGAGLTLSDVVTGIAGGLSWPAGGGFPINTLGAWPQGGDAELWFQLRGLPAGTPYRSTIEVIPTEEGRKERISISSDELSEGPVTIVRRTLGLQQLRAGTYRLVVTVRAGEQTASREQEIFIVEK